MPLLTFTFSAMQQKHILFFDGYCSLCNSTVDWLFRIDKKEKILFGSLQGQTAKDVLPEELIEEVDSVVLATGTDFKIKSDAIFEVLRVLGGGWRILSVFRILPRGFRDWVYDWVAANRYKWFGKEDSCRMPTPEEKKRFVD